MIENTNVNINTKSTSDNFNYEDSKYIDIYDQDENEDE
jgi:hypothetical protein